jgi:two-component system cell cycle response regulator
VNGSATILIAEDSTVIRAVLRAQLEHEGYRVAEAPDGLAAVELCRALKPDAVLLDIEMPGLNGHEVLSRIKCDAELQDIPVVFLTGRTSADDLVAGLRAGAHDYLRKPFEPTELIARVGGAVHVKQLQDELRRRNAELEEVARIDPLTGIYNRRHLNDQLAVLSKASRRQGTPLALILFDVDHFKRVNDTFGHSVGDRALRECAGRISDATRAPGLVGRWGGEEFIVILADTTLEASHIVAERIRRSIGDTPVSVGDLLLTLTVSGGCAAAHDGDVDALIYRADAAMYRAKSSGRDRIVVGT